MLSGNFDLLGILRIYLEEPVCPSDYLKIVLSGSIAVMEVEQIFAKNPIFSSYFKNENVTHKANHTSDTAIIGQQEKYS